MKSKLSFRKISIILLLAGLIIFSVFCLTNTSASNAERFFVEYMNVAVSDRTESIIQYMHFEDLRYRELALLSATDRLLDYEVIDVELLTDELWVFTCNITSDSMPEGGTVYNFVGIIDGDFRVMNNVRHIPEDMKKSLDLSKYTYPDLDTVDIDDIILY